MTKQVIDVLLIEDDPMVQEVNRQFVEKVDGFRVIGVASSGAEGLNKIEELRPDLVILDIFMPTLDGMETLARIRREQRPVDVIVISAANDSRTIRRMLQNGAVDYIMKPFKFERVKQALGNYLVLRSRLEEEEATVSQAELDELLHGGARPDFETMRTEDLPKGLQSVTLKQIMLYLMSRPEPLSAEEVAEGVGIARVTARRYLEFLEKTGQVRLDLQYGVGRPVNKYVWHP